MGWHSPGAGELTSAIDPGAWLDAIANAPVPVPTGERRLDMELMGGMRPGVYLLGGGPGSGKSALALQIALNAAIGGTPTLYVSCEMALRQVALRLLSLHAARTPGLAEVAWSQPRANRWATEAALASMLAACGGDLRVSCDLTTAEEVSDAADECDGPALVVVDYLQLLRSDSIVGKGDEYERVSAVSERLRAAGEPRGRTMLVISSLNRDSLRGQKVDMHVFRGSGNLEYDAAGAMVLSVGDGDVRELHVVKHRFGPMTDEPVMATFDGAHNRFNF